MASPSKLRRGDVVLVPFPFADLSGRKLRPAVVISADPQGPEVILAFITSVMTNRSLRGAEVELVRGNAEFHITGLKVDSLIRLDKIVTLATAVVSRRLGKAGPVTLNALGSMLRKAFDLR